MKIIKSVAIHSLLIWGCGIVALLYGGDGAVGGSWIARYFGLGIFGWVFGLIILLTIFKLFSISSRVNAAFLAMFSIFYVIFPVEWFFEMAAGGGGFLSYVSEKIRGVEVFGVGAILVVMLRDIFKATIPVMLFVVPVYLFLRFVGKRVFAGAR